MQIERLTLSDVLTAPQRRRAWRRRAWSQPAYLAVVAAVLALTIAVLGVAHGP